QGRLQDALKAYENAYRLDPTLIGARQAADSLRGGAPAYAPSAYPQPPTVSAPHPYVAAPPPVNPADLYMPAAQRYRRARGCITAGVLLAMFGLCVPPVGLFGGLTCGVIAMLRGSIAGGLVVIVLAIVLGLMGSWLWQLLSAMIQSVAPM
ncbi:MAG: hypothetical protein N2554_00660, partial [Fimbriimonadales bacterium]|nr:hypothetical protein [Fimbriimonadales bacterium]